MSLAKVTIIGNLGRDPETRYTPSGALNVQFSVAASRKWKDGSGQDQENTTWFRVTAWGRLAETLVALSERAAFGKGKQVYIEGRIELREYEKDGQIRTSLDVNASEVQLLGSRDDARPVAQMSSYDSNMQNTPF
jgi:single-strand DNA-binding protein